MTRYKIGTVLTLEKPLSYYTYDSRNLNGCTEGPFIKLANCPWADSVSEISITLIDSRNEYRNGTLLQIVDFALREKK